MTRERLKEFSGAFAKLREVTSSFVVSVCPSVRPQGTTRLPLDGFTRNMIYEDFSKIVEKIQTSLKRDNNNGYFTWQHVYNYDNISLNSWNEKFFGQKL